MRKLVFLDAARADLVEIANYISKRERSRSRGADVAKRLADRCTELAATTAMLGRPRPEYGRDLRSTPYLGYLIFFRVSDEAMEIVAIVLGGRDLPSAFNERGEET